MIELQPIKEISEQSLKEEEIANHVRSKIEEIRGSASRISHEGIWMRNLAYVIGYSGVNFNAQTRQYIPINNARNYGKKNKLHINKILPTLQNRGARLLKNPPKYDVRPESSDTEDKEAARLSLQVLLCLWEKLNINQKRIALMMWVQECGHAYGKISWDTTLGKRIENEFGESFYEGDVRFDVISPFEIFPDPLCSSWEEVKQSYIIQAKVRRLEYFQSRYPERGHAVEPEDTWLMSAQYEQRINSMNTRGPMAGSELQAKNSAIELIKYEARCEEYPNGRMIVVANGVLLEDKELPIGEIPFEKFDDIVIGGKYYSEAITTHLCPVQDAYNTVIRRRHEWTKKLLAGKYSAARGSGLQQESMNDGTEIVYYDPVQYAPNGGQPSPIQIPMIPQWAYNEELSLEKIFNDISGISEVSQGTLPSASIPAIGMQLLVEQDETRIGIMTEQHERAWAAIGSLILKYVQKFYKTPRKLKMAGKNLEYTVKDIQGEQLKGNTDVYVIRGSTLPGSKTLRRNDILNAYSQGLLGDLQDPKVRERVLGMLEFGDVQEIWEEYGLDMHQIKRGLQKLEIGEQIAVNEYDNHALWVQELNKFRKGDKFEDLPLSTQIVIMEQMEMRVKALMKLSNAIPEPISQDEVSQEAEFQGISEPFNPENIPPNEETMLPEEMSALGEAQGLEELTTQPAQ